MIYTESEAKEKWCPHARVAFLGGVGNKVSVSMRKAVERDPDGLTRGDRDYIESQIKDCNCIVSACSQWRWFDDSRQNRRGYCGLAGKPDQT